MDVKEILENEIPRSKATGYLRCRRTKDASGNITRRDLNFCLLPDYCHKFQCPKIRTSAAIRAFVVAWAIMASSTLPRRYIAQA
ncbi:MAG: hypothetical protein ABIJ52_00290 [Pseudomonadota bacterium]|nr:hypothetical protein [Pseudomonadota bacterium]MBU1569547.1 hypothetical protein [Pseudomonadota bacterium]